MEERRRRLAGPAAALAGAARAAGLALAMLAGLGVEMAAGAGAARAQPTGNAAAIEPQRIAVLPMLVHSAEDHAYLRDGLADMLAARLGRSARVAVVRLADPALATTDPTEARAAAREAGADFVLFGSFTRFGEGASLDVHCASVAGDDPRDPRSIFIQAGKIGDLIPGIEGLAEKVVRHVTGARSAPGTAPAGAESAALDRALAEIERLRARIDLLESRGEEPGSPVLGETGGGAAPTLP